MSATALWTKYVAWLERHVPLAHANLAGPASDAQIAKVERVTGHALPESVKEVWRMNDGQKETKLTPTDSEAIVCLPTLSFLSTHLAIATWREWDKLRRTEKSVDELQRYGRSPEKGVVKPLYTHPGWIPLWSDPSTADHIGVDLAPGAKGKSGQVINFGRDETEHRCFAPSFEGLLQILLEEVKSGAWRASKRMGPTGRKLPWFGDPEENFFNALHDRWKARMTPDPAALAAEKEEKDQAKHEALIKEAEKALKAKNHKRAETLLHQARGVGRETGLCSSLLAELYTKQKRYRQAEEAWAVATDRASLATDYWEARCNNLIDNLEAYEEADAVAKLALGSHPYEAALVEIRVLAAAVRKDFAAMVPLCRRYLELVPDFTPGRINYAWALAATGKIAEAIAQSSKAFDAADEDESDVAAEAAFFLYALADRSAQPRWLARLRALLDDGTRADEWDFAAVIAAAGKRKHPEKAWLAKLADVVNDVADLDELASWPAWEAAASKRSGRKRK
jgi:cell wall assembly regulator SMI1